MDLEIFKSKFKADDYYNILDELVRSKRISKHEDFPEWFKGYCEERDFRKNYNSRKLLTGLFAFRGSELGEDYWVDLYKSKEENMVDGLFKRKKD